MNDHDYWARFDVAMREALHRNGESPLNWGEFVGALRERYEDWFVTGASEPVRPESA